VITLSHEMTLGIKKAALIKIADAPTGNPAKQSGILGRNIEEMPNRKWGERCKPIHDGTTPGWIGSIRSKKVQEAIDERPSALQNTLTMLGTPVAIDPGP